MWERLIGSRALISMECFHGHRLSLPEWMDEWSFLGSVFLGHFHWVSTKNTGYWYVSSWFRLNCSPPQNFLEVIFYPALLTVPMPTKQIYRMSKLERTSENI